MKKIKHAPIPYPRAGTISWLACVLRTDAVDKEYGPERSTVSRKCEKCNKESDHERSQFTFSTVDRCTTCGRTTSVQDN